MLMPQKNPKIYFEINNTTYSSTELLKMSIEDLDKLITYVEENEFNLAMYTFLISVWSRKAFSKQNEIAKKVVRIENENEISLLHNYGQ